MKAHIGSRFWSEKEDELRITLYCLMQPVEQMNGTYSLLYALSCVGESTVVPPYPRVMLSKTYHGYVKLQLIPNAIYNMILV
jgi:hypothetical protein